MFTLQLRAKALEVEPLMSSSRNKILGVSVILFFFLNRHISSEKITKEIKEVCDEVDD